MTPGTYAGLPMAEYLSMRAVSSGVINAMADDCPASAWYQSYLNAARIRDFNDASDAGTIAHSILLEGGPGKVAVIDPQDHPAEKGGGIPTGWTNKSIRAARDAARAEGRIPVLVGDMAVIQAMVDSANSFLADIKYTEPAIYSCMREGGGDSEVTYVWQDGSTLCRIRPDRIAKDCQVIVDAKFSLIGSHPNRWARRMLSQYATAAAFYRRGIESLYSVTPTYVFLVVDQNPPHLCSLVGLDPMWIAYGDARVARGLTQWDKCVASQVWEGYPKRVAYPDFPAYLMTEMEEE